MESHQSENMGYPPYIKAINNGMASLTLTSANAILGSKQNLHRLVIEEGFFIPSLSSRAITNQYLMGVLGGIYQQFRINQIRNPPKPKREWSKIDMISFITSRLGNQTQLGFGPTTLPDKDFLVTISYNLDPNIEMFTGVDSEEDIVQIPVSFLERIRFFDPALKSQKGSVIKKTEEAKERQKRSILERRKRRKMRRNQLLVKESGKILSEIHALEDALEEEIKNN